MPTPQQILKAQGFKILPYRFQTSYKYQYWGVVESGQVVAKAGVETGSWDRNPTSVVVFVKDKRRVIQAQYSMTRHNWMKFDDAQQARLIALLGESKTAGPAEKPTPKPRPASPMKGVKLTEEEKASNAVWRHLGYLTCVGFVGKELREDLCYVKAGKYIRLEDPGHQMAYVNIRDSYLKTVNMNVADLEAFLVKHGAKKVVQKRIKRSYSLYD